jgi:hypothetical protein
MPVVLRFVHVLFDEAVARPKHNAEPAGHREVDTVLNFHVCGCDRGFCVWRQWACGVGGCNGKVCVCVASMLKFCVCVGGRSTDCGFGRKYGAVWAR